jgi:hypothetical protein
MRKRFATACTSAGCVFAIPSHHASLLEHGYDEVPVGEIAVPAA